MILLVFILVIYIIYLVRAFIRTGKGGRLYKGTLGYQPYSNVYGENLKKGPCAVTVTASPEMDVVAIVRYDNLDGDVAGHLLIEKGKSGTICLPTGKFQVFFYSGRDWDSQKEMDCGLSGGFTKDEMFQEDPFPKTYREGTHWSYSLRLVVDGRRPLRLICSFNNN